MNKKKKIFWLSSFSKSKTGFGRHSKEILSHLYKTGKYEIVEYATWPFRLNDPNCKSMPWKCYGAAPDNDAEIQKLASDPTMLRSMQYGGVYIDSLIEQEKPDVFFGVEDIWAFNGYWDKKWFNKIHSVIWTTLDSVPIYKMAHENAEKIKNYWVWASFAKDEMAKLGHEHVKVVHGAFDTSDFFPVSEKDKKILKANHRIDEDCKVFGFVFRNQPRKLVGQLIEGFALYKQREPLAKVKLLLHTNWEEVWNIKQFMEEFGVEKEDVLTTYICSSCGHYSVKPYDGQGIRCEACNKPTSMSNPSTTFGLKESELNLIYNLMDAYIHPMTSGGLEMPIVEAMMAGLPVATVGYSCGLEYTNEDFVYPLEFSYGREPVSNFKKAHVKPSSIANFINRICSSNQNKINKIRQRGIEWARNKFDTKIVGKQVEEFIDSLPEIDTSAIDFSRKKCDEDYEFKTDLPSDKEWLIDLYKGFFGRIENEDSVGVRAWSEKLSKKIESRESIYKKFKDIAIEENQLADKPISFKDFFEENGKKRILYIIPESIGDCMISQSVLDGIRESYSEEEWDIYVSCKQDYFEVFGHIPYIKKLIPYVPRMDNYQWCEGIGANEKGLVDIAFHPYFGTQRAVSYIHNGLDTNFLQE